MDEWISSPIPADEAWQLEECVRQSLLFRKVVTWPWGVTFFDTAGGPTLGIANHETHIGYVPQDTELDYYDIRAKLNEEYWATEGPTE